MTRHEIRLRIYALQGHLGLPFDPKLPRTKPMLRAYLESLRATQRRRASEDIFDMCPRVEDCAAASDSAALEDWREYEDIARRY